MANSSQPSTPAFAGTRTIRFERSAAEPADVLADLHQSTPDLVLDTAAEWRIESDTLVVQVGTALIEIRATNNSVELHGQSTGADSESRSHLVKILDALGDLIADPERRSTRAELTRLGRERDDEIMQRAAELFDHPPRSLTHEQALRLVVASIDLTTLAGDDTPGRIRALCALAHQPDPTDPTVGPCAAVCVYPNLVSVASELLEGSSVAVASVAGAFPSGLSSLDVRLRDIAEAVAAGADEIDIVLNRSAFVAGDDATVVSELRAMRDQIGPRVMKVILETSELETPTAIHKAASLALGAGADWIKTSTGKSKVGATPAAVLAMAEAIRDHGTPAGLKVSGGVRTSAEALGYLAIIEAALGPDALHPERVRFGASGLLGAVVSDLISY